MINATYSLFKKHFFLLPLKTQINWKEILEENAQFWISKSKAFLTANTDSILCVCVCVSGSSHCVPMRCELTVVIVGRCSDAFAARGLSIGDVLVWRRGHPGNGGQASRRSLGHGWIATVQQELAIIDDPGTCGVQTHWEERRMAVEFGQQWCVCVWVGGIHVWRKWWVCSFWQNIIYCSRWNVYKSISLCIHLEKSEKAKQQIKNKKLQKSLDGTSVYDIQDRSSTFLITLWARQQKLQC